MRTAAPIWRSIPSPIFGRQRALTTCHRRSAPCGLRHGIPPQPLSISRDCLWTRALNTSTTSLGTARPRNYHGEIVDPTIYALSTAPGQAAIAVIRISGPACLDIYHGLCPGKKPPQPRYATVRTLYEPGKPLSPDSVLDASALILYFPAPRTVTGEDVLELHVHGGPAIIKAVLAAIPRCRAITRPGEGRSSVADPDIRYAEPGEFTKRAFLNNRLDLTQVEALGDTLAATTEAQRRLSVRGSGSELAKRYETWRKQLLYARGELEALIDFSEDQHFDESPAELCASVSAQVRTLRRALELHARNAVRGELLRNGISLSLLGAPNAGKSSLLNCIVGREAAIVSREAGTTRDVVEVGLDIGGFLCRVGDTAGLRKAIAQGDGEGIGPVEEEGMRRAKARAAESDVVIVVLSFERNGQVAGQLVMDPEVMATAFRLVQEKNNVLIVLNKVDQTDADGPQVAIRQVQHALPSLASNRIIPISCVAAATAIAEATIDLTAAKGPSPSVRPTSTNTTTDPGNLQSFLRALITHFHSLTAALTPNSEVGEESDPSIWQASLGASERHRLLLEKCISALTAFLHEAEPAATTDAVSGTQGEDDGESEVDLVLAAEHLRSAADCLAKITGKGGNLAGGDVEEVLGVVFEKFCVGK